MFSTLDSEASSDEAYLAQMRVTIAAVGRVGDLIGVDGVGAVEPGQRVGLTLDPEKEVRIADQRDFDGLRHAAALCAQLFVLVG